MSDTITAGTSDEHIREAIRRHALDEAEGPYRAEIAALYGCSTPTTPSSSAASCGR